MPHLSQHQCVEGVIEASKDIGEADSALRDERSIPVDGIYGRNNIAVQLT